MRVFLVGLGTVGKALLELLRAHEGALIERHGLAPVLVGVSDSRGSAIAPGGLDTRAVLETKARHGTVGAMPLHGAMGAGVGELLGASGAQVLIESAPTDLARADGAIGRLRGAMSAGVHVVSANKAPLALAMPALLELARYNRVRLRFSATVGGGTPVLDWAERCALGNRVLGVRAIINGTTNFILSRMSEHAEAFEPALAEAVRLGYAEADPSGDIDGHDSAMKLVILANHVLGMRASYGDVRIAGIRGLPASRIAQAKERGCVVKLIASLGPQGLCVAPEEVPMLGALNVPGSLNAVTLTLQTGGEISMVGRGAGGPETATAIVRDLVDIWRSSRTS